MIKAFNKHYRKSIDLIENASGSEKIEMAEKVLDWFRENRYEVAGAPREVFFVAPEPHGGGTQDDMLTEIQVPIRKAS